MFNFLAGMAFQIMLVVSFEHKTDAIALGIVFALVLTLKHRGYIALPWEKAVSTANPPKLVKRRELL